MDMQPSIFVIDDEPDNFDVIETLLHHEGYRLHYAPSGQRALDRLESVQPDVILLDVMMPEIDGIEVCRRIKAQTRWQAVPIVMVTALTDKEDLARCLEAGADDFVSKPVNGIELAARVRSMLRISQQYQEIQQLCQTLASHNRQLSDFNLSLENKVRQRTAQLQKMLLYDGLTKLPSRIFLLQKLDLALQAALPNQPSPAFALLYLDCDRFKLINSSLGHDLGNQLLVAIAQRLKQYLKPDDCLARLGEDEFCFFLAEPGNFQAICHRADEILQSFRAPFEVESYELFITACMGITTYGLPNITPSGPATPQILLQEADTAMYRAKAMGKGCYQVFEPQMHSATLERLQLEHDLQIALDREEFFAYYQPIINLKTMKIAGFEALMRWQHPKRGMVSPGVFIPCMEETGMIVPAGMLILRKACQQLKEWHAAGYPDLMMSVNLSVRQFTDPLLIEDIDRILIETGIPPERLKLEITESAIMENVHTAIAMTKQLRSRKIQLSIDDFGTGYSSLSYLNQFPVDSLKIDKSFLHNSLPGSPNAKLVEVIVALGYALGISLIAEGVENEQQLLDLQKLGCQYGQGFLFSKPLMHQDATRLLAQTH